MRLHSNLLPTMLSSTCAHFLITVPFLRGVDIHMVGSVALIWCDLYHCDSSKAMSLGYNYFISLRAISSPPPPIQEMDMVKSGVKNCQNKESCWLEFCSVNSSSISEIGMFISSFGSIFLSPPP